MCTEKGKLAQKTFTKPFAMNFKIYLALLTAVVFLSSFAGDPNVTTTIQPVYVAPGVGLGTIIAVVVSWSRNNSILWAIVHGILGWLYVIYVLIVGRNDRY
jgi:hypothetical protein